MFDQTLEGYDRVGQTKLREEHSRKGSKTDCYKGNNQYKGPEADLCLAYVE